MTSLHSPCSQNTKEFSGTTKLNAQGKVVEKGVIHYVNAEIKSFTDSGEASKDHSLLTPAKPAELSDADLENPDFLENNSAFATKKRLEEAKRDIVNSISASSAGKQTNTNTDKAKAPRMFFLTRGQLNTNRILCSRVMML